MAKASVNKLYRTFVKGLITEASPLTYPEDASIDEANCVLFRRGNRSRRLGIDFENNHQLSSYTLYDDTWAQTEYRWEAVANKVDINFLVHQVGPMIYFYNMAVRPLSNGLKYFDINLHNYLAPNAEGLAQESVEMVSGKGWLFICSSKTEPIMVEYDPDSDNITVTRVYIRIRDFTGIDDGLAADEQPATLSSSHDYNLRNQGWKDPQGGTTPISEYFTEFSKYPSHSQQWWVAKASSPDEDAGVEVGDFIPKLLGKFSFGNTRAPRGHYIVDAFYIDRGAVSGIAGLGVETTTERPRAVAFFSGRAWYGVNSTVYFSQVLDDKRKAGYCYQEADPTAEDISDLLPTDGGVVQIPEMGQVIKMVATGPGVMVFANNGVWYISGTDAGFSAIDMSVSKVSNIGTDSPQAIVEADSTILWWSKVGIQGLSQKSGMFGPVEGSFDKTNISEQTIQSLYINGIPDENKRYAKGIFDPATNTVQWLVNTNPNHNKWTYNYILNLDLTLGSFYPWTVDDTDPAISGVYLNTTLNDLGEPTSIRSTFLNYVCLANKRTTFGFFRNFDFVDWETFDNVGKTYLSFIETGYELLEDAMRKKQTPYVFCYFRQTERSFVPSGDDFVLDRPSSCYLQVKWDWASSSSSNKWSPKVQVYRLKRPGFVDTNDLSFDYGFPIIWTKNKIRGFGKAIQFRYESNERGKDFDLLGWSVAYTGNTTP